jgi:hypothetical protein
MEVTLHATSSAHQPELSPGVRYGLLAAAIAAALLGLIVLDVEGAPGVKRRLAHDERTTECIVAAALFVGIAKHSHAP